MTEQNTVTKKQFSREQLLFLLFWIYTLLVIFWGAWVRISHSGDGCGDHWPLCTGELIPTFEQKKTIVEYLHRLMSGSYGLIVFYIFLKYRKHSSAIIRSLNTQLFVFMIIEALLGALLVKFKLVTVNDSFLRLVFMTLHQWNSFMLTGVTYLFYKSLDVNFVYKPSWQNKIFLFVPVTGAIASLSTTLFPSISLLDGIISDFSHDSHIFIKLRVIHPFLALVTMGSFMSYLFMKNKNRLALEILFAISVGIVTLATLSPLPLKIIHLGIAHVLWARFLSFNWNNQETQSS